MKKSSRRAISRLLAGVMLFTSVFSSSFVSAADSSLALYAEASTSGGALDPSTSSSGLAVAGKTYSADFKALTAETPLAGWKSEDGIFTLSDVSNGTFYHSSGYGLAIKPNDTFTVDVAGNADISLTLSKYAKADAVFEVTNAAGESVGTVSAYVEVDKTQQTFAYTGDATVLTFKLNSTGQAYLADVTAVNAAAPVGEAENFELWLDDIAKDVESTADDGTTVITKTFEQQEIAYKDSKIKLVGWADTKFTPEWGNGQNITRAGKTVNGYKAGKRNATANDIATVPDYGDGTAVVFSPAATGTFVAYIASTSFLRVWDFDAATGERYGYTDSDLAPEFVAFKAQAGHTYVLSTTGKTNNMVYAGFEYMIDEPTTVSVSLNNVDAAASALDSLEVYLTDAALGGEPAAVIKKDTTSVDLAKDHTYNLTTNDGGVKALIADKESFKANVDAVTIDLYDIPDVTLKGEITNIDAASVTGLKFTNMVNKKEYEATIDGLNYSVVMKPGDYNTTITTTNGGFTKDRVKTVVGQETVNEVYVEYLDRIEMPTDLALGEASKLKYVSVNEAAPIKVNNSTSIRATAGDQIVIPVTGKQLVEVSGWYAGTWNINGQSEVTATSSNGAASPAVAKYYTNGTETEVTVNVTGEGANYLYWVKLTDVVDFKSEINVPGDYDTLKDAVTAIKAMADRPEGEDGRVTINMTADIEEQIVFDAPYVTLNGNGHTLSWYYGVGTYYYSIGDGGLYNESLFRDKYSYKEGDGQLWGGVAIIRGDYFRAVDTTFKNTYNYEVTAKDKLDYAGPVTANFDRTLDVTDKTHQERSNCFYIDAKHIEAENCKMLSSQDTFGRNGSANNGYFVYLKDCVIGGNVDYICGEFTLVAENCELQWKTYKDNAATNAKIGYITAPKTSPYIFKNCEVTSTGDEGVDSVLGYWGRTWGANSNATFIGCETNGMINETGWGDMSGNDLGTATFYELANTSNGEPMAVTSAGKEAPEELAKSATSDSIVKDILGDWKPEFMDLAKDGLLGDADMSGVLTANDAAVILAYSIDSTVAYINGYNLGNCDVDGVDGINAADASAVLAMVLAEGPVELDPVTVFVVGDSTGCDYINTDNNYFYKRMGFGTALPNYLDEKATVTNLAISGRSSKSFLTEANYATLKSSIKEGDYLIIAFGHNDEKLDDPTRGTTPGGTKETAGSFKESLYTNYIKVAQDAGATPILCTPTVRRTDSGTWSGNSLHQANNGDYAQDVRDLAKELNLLCVDNTQMGKDLYDKLTPAESVYLHAWLSSESTSVDNTHLNAFGAKYVAYMMTQAIKASDLGLKDYVLDAQAPTKADLEQNPEYVEPSKDDPTDLTSKLWTTTAPFYGTVFGDCGGQGKLQATDAAGEYIDQLAIDDATGKTFYAITENEDKSVTLRAGSAAEDGVTAVTSVGKISGSTDGLCMYYMPISASGNFEISADMTIKAFGSHNQVAAGAIVHDKVRIDTYDKEVYNYVAASITDVTKIGGTDSTTGNPTYAAATFARIDKKLAKGAQISEAPVIGGTVKVAIKKIGDKYTVTYGDTVQEYTVPMTGTAYAGFFVARCAEATFSNIVYNNEVVE